MSKQHTLLAIDTSTAMMAGAILQQELLLAEVQTEAERNHAIHIMTNIESMLKAVNLSVQDISAFITGIGPGSYTGVRIAVTAAKTLAWTSNKPVIGVSSLEGLAYGALLQEPQLLQEAGSAIVIPLMDARRGQVYTATFNADHATNWVRSDKDQIMLMKDLCEKLQERLALYMQAGIKELWFVGDVGIHDEAIQQMLTIAKEYSITVRSLTHAMQGLAIARLGELQLHQMTADELAAAHDLVPNYAQLTEAEVKQNAKEKEEGQ